MCWVVRNPCEKVRSLDKDNLVDDSPQYACSKVVRKPEVFMVNMLPLNPLGGGGWSPMGMIIPFGALNYLWTHREGNSRGDGFVDSCALLPFKARQS